MIWLLQNPLILWFAIGALILAVEVGTDSGWLLWPAGAAALTGFITHMTDLPFTGQLILFALLTIVTTLAGRRFFPKRPLSDDINDMRSRLIGVDGVVVENFVNGRGRVFVDGKEWDAEADVDQSIRLSHGEKVVVLETEGARLHVRAD